MCMFATKEESYEAFKKIWAQAYGNTFPTLAMAQRYSGNDKAHTWLQNVTNFYNG